MSIRENLSRCLFRQTSVQYRGGDIQMKELQSANCCNFTLILICNSFNVLIELVGDMEELFSTPAAGAVVRMESFHRRPLSAVSALKPIKTIRALGKLCNTGQGFDDYTFCDTNIFFHDI